MTKDETIADTLYQWVQNVSHTVKDLSPEYEKNKNVFVYFLYKTIQVNGEDTFKDNTEVFHSACKKLLDKLSKEYPLIRIPEFQRVMNDHFEKIHAQSKKWTASSKNLTPSGFDLYQVLASELGKDFMYTKDEEGDEIADVILFSFSELMNKDLPDQLKEV